MIRASALSLIVSAAGPLAAETPFLDWPMDCIPGQTCFIEDYVDADPGPGQADYTCGLKSRDGHRGTDIALLNFAAMDARWRAVSMESGQRLDFLRPCEARRK